jgi:hypothetical protein
MPYAKKHGIRLVEVQRVWQRSSVFPAGTKADLYHTITHPDLSGDKIPVRMNDTGKPSGRACTWDFKFSVIEKWCLERYEPPIIRGIGFSVDEQHRSEDFKHEEWEVPVFPLLDPTLRIRRVDCLSIIHEAGLPEPPPSSCWFCPFHNIATWQRMRREEPTLFWKAVELERFINERNERMGRDPVWLCSALVPLDRAIGLQYAFAFDEMSGVDGGCVSGHCFT